MHKDQIISQLIKEKIITISPDKPFTYASGMLSPIYTDLRLTVSYPELRDMIASDLANLIAAEFPQATIIGGVATAGIPHAALVAEKLHLPMIYVRPKPKDHGKGRQIEGRFSENDQIVLIDKSEEHTSELQSRFDLVCRLLLEKKKKKIKRITNL